MFNILNKIQELSAATEGKFAIATIMMISIFIVTCLLLFIVIRSFQHRREAIKVELPDIDVSGEVILEENRFQEDKLLTVELVSSDEDVADGKIKDDNENIFVEALTLETRKYISKDEDYYVSMPEVKEVYEKLKEDKEKERAKRLHELAKADNKEKLSEIGGI